MDTSIGPTKDLTSGPHSPDLEILWAPAVARSHTTTGRPGEHGISMVCDTFVQVHSAIDSLQASIAAKPESEGTVTLKKNSVWDYPNIDAKYVYWSNSSKALNEPSHFTASGLQKAMSTSFFVAYAS